MPTVVYNSATLSAWQAEANKLSRQIPQYRATIESNKAALIPLQSRLSLVQSELSTVQSNITWAEINQAQDRSNHWHYSHRHGHYHYHQPGLLHTIVDVAAAYNLSTLYAQRSTLQAREAHILAQMQPHESNIDANRTALQRATADLAQHNAQILAGTTFLQTLKNNPGMLIAQLKKAITTELKAYSDKHPAGLSPQVRICLYDLEKKLNYLSVAAEHATLNALQLNYLDLCALLQNMYARVEQEGRDSEFKRILTSLLDTTHIAFNGDLPDELRTGQSTSVRFAFLAGQNSLFSLTPEDLAKLEEVLYNQKLSEVESGLFIDEIQKRVKAVVSSIKAEVEAKKLKKEHIDYHFYTQILEDMWHVVNHRQDQATIQHLSVLADAASGSPSTGKKITGALFALMGVLLIAASIACLVATFGGSALASGFGAALGLSLIQSQICLGVSASVTAIAGTGLSFWGGFKFKDGMRQGLSQDITDFQHEIESRPVLA